jgi:hypothetical protein
MQWLRRIWKLINRIGFILMAIAAAIVVFEAGGKFFRHQPVGRLEGSSFELPPELDEFYTNLGKKLDSDALVPRVLADEDFKRIAGKLREQNFAGDKINEVSDTEKEYLIRRMTRLLPTKLEIEIPYGFKSLKSYWTATISNSSSAQITAAQLYLSGAKFALVTRDNASKIAQSTENLVDIGDLRPSEKVQVSIWSVYGLDYYRYAPDIRLTHRSGVGKVIIPRLVTGFPAFLDKYDFVFYMLLFWLLIIVGGSALAKKMQ